jgi:hypothetical protein
MTCRLVTATVTARRASRARAPEVHREARDWSRQVQDVVARAISTSSRGTFHAGLLLSLLPTQLLGHRAVNAEIALL